MPIEHIRYILFTVNEATDGLPSVTPSPHLGEDRRMQREARFVHRVGEHLKDLLQQRDEELLVELRGRAGGSGDAWR